MGARAMLSRWTARPLEAVPDLWAGNSLVGILIVVVIRGP
jgi:hypothetical protein